MVGFKSRLRKRLLRDTALEKGDVFVERDGDTLTVGTDSMFVSDLSTALVAEADLLRREGWVADGFQDSGEDSDALAEFYYVRRSRNGRNRGYRRRSR